MKKMFHYGVRGNLLVTTVRRCFIKKKITISCPSSLKTFTFFKSRPSYWGFLQFIFVCYRSSFCPYLELIYACFIFQKTLQIAYVSSFQHELDPSIVFFFSEISVCMSFFSLFLFIFLTGVT